MNLQTVELCTAAALAPAMMWKHIFDRKKSPAASSTDSKDILEESEHAAYEQAARVIQARKLTPTKAVPAPEVVQWQDHADVYHPALMELAEAARHLGLPTKVSCEKRKSILCIDTQALSDIRTHLASNTKVELDAYLVAVQQYIPAEGGKETPISFEYTSETWNALYPKLQQLTEGTTVVGSCHSHPGLGVFLSTTDIETQATVFSQEWQIAIVHDPIKDDIGYFISDRGVPIQQVIAYNAVPG